jgi:predicted transposase/invertase (TIGR01784 family)
MRPGIDPKVDYAFKRVFGTEDNRDVLIDLLNAILQLGPGREVVEVEILNPFNDKAYANDKLSVVDVKARDASGRQFVVEMQMVARAHHRQRVLYYATKLYSSQLAEGEEFDSLRAAYTISIVDTEVIARSDVFHTRYVMHDAAHDLTFTDDFVVHMIELPKFRTAVGDLGDRLAGWCYFLRNADHLDTDNLPVPLTTPAIRKAMETLRMISQTERERIEYEDRVNRLREQRTVENQIARERKAIEEGARRNENEARRIAEEARKNEIEARRVEEEARRAKEEFRLIAEQHAALAERQAAIAEEQVEREARDREAQVGRISLALRVLKRPDIPRDDLLARPLEDLRRLASLLELEALRGAP